MKNLTELITSSLIESGCVKKPDDLKTLMDGVSLKKDEDGFYVTTHRARSESYKTPHDIPSSVIKRIETTG